MHRVDSSSSRALLNREGLGGLKHVDLAYLWCQEKRRSGIYTVNAIGTQFCPADTGTKPQAAPRCKLLCHMIGVAASSDYGVVPVGHDEFWKAWKDDASKKAYARASKVSMDKLKHVRRLLAFSTLELSEAAPTSTSLPSAMADISILNILMYFGAAILVMLIVVYLYFFFVYFAYKEIRSKTLKPRAKP